MAIEEIPKLLPGKHPFDPILPIDLGNIRVILIGPPAASLFSCQS